MRAEAALKPPARGGLSVNAVLQYFETRTRAFSATKRAAFLRLFRQARVVEVLVTHDWPAGIAPESLQVPTARPVGNAVTRDVLNTLQPQLHLCGHMHMAHRADLVHVAKSNTQASASSGAHVDRTTKVCCLSKVGFPQAVAFFQYDWELHLISEMELPKVMPKCPGFEEAVGSGSE